MLMIGFQDSAAVNKRQFIPGNLTKLYVTRGTESYPQVPYAPAFATLKQKKYLDAYYDFMKASGEMNIASSSTLTPAKWSTLMTVYAIDLRKNPAKLLEASEQVGASNKDECTMHVEFSAAVACSMFICTMSSAHIEFYLNNEPGIKYIQGCF